MTPSPVYRTARAVLRYNDTFLLAIHASFRRQHKKRWGLPGGGIEWGEQPKEAVKRELREELDLQLDALIELGPYTYKGHQHLIYGADVDHAVEHYDTRELLELRWFSKTELNRLAPHHLHAGYELQAIDRFVDLDSH